MGPGAKLEVATGGVRWMRRWIRSRRRSVRLLGKQEQVRLALCCLLAGEHLLIEDRPGLGKSTWRKPWPAVGT